jgi:hypothetical protein
VRLASHQLVTSQVPVVRAWITAPSSAQSGASPAGLAVAGVAAGTVGTGARVAREVAGTGRGPEPVTVGQTTLAVAVEVGVAPITMVALVGLVSC